MTSSDKAVSIEFEITPLEFFLPETVEAKGVGYYAG